jgi:hypothetical protein
MAWPFLWFFSRLRGGYGGTWWKVGGGEAGSHGKPVSTGTQRSCPGTWAENHRRHDPEVAAVMDKIAMRAYKVRTVPAADAARVAAVFRDTLYLSCVEKMQQLQMSK